MDQEDRWAEVLAVVVDAIGAGPRIVVVDSFQSATGFADRLAAAVRDRGRACVRSSGRSRSPAPDAIVVADGPGHRGDVLIWLRTPPPADAAPGPRPDADIVVDLQDPDWPVIRHVDRALAPLDRWYTGETAAFFGARATTWDTRFGDDLPAYARAVHGIGIRPGAVAADVGCGTGRALPALRAAVGPTGTVIGIDLTRRMLLTAQGQGRDRDAFLVVGDARRLPLGDATVDVVFAAGLVNHLPDVAAGLSELARVTRPGGRLALFHPSGRAALAARHGRTLRPDEPLAEIRLRDELDRAGWHLARYDDAPDHFFVVARR